MSLSPGEMGELRFQASWLCTGDPFRFIDVCWHKQLKQGCRDPPTDGEWAHWVCGEGGAGGVAGTPGRARRTIPHFPLVLCRFASVSPLRVPCGVCHPPSVGRTRRNPLWECASAPRCDQIAHEAKTQSAVRVQSLWRGHSDRNVVRNLRFSRVPHSQSTGHGCPSGFRVFFSIVSLKGQPSAPGVCPELATVAHSGCSRHSSMKKAKFSVARDQRRRTVQRQTDSVRGVNNNTIPSKRGAASSWRCLSQSARDMSMGASGRYEVWTFRTPSVHPQFSTPTPVWPFWHTADLGWIRR